MVENCARSEVKEEIYPAFPERVENVKEFVNSVDVIVVFPSKVLKIPRLRPRLEILAYPPVSVLTSIVENCPSFA